MISFGFTIYKFFGKTSTTPEGQRQLLTPRIVDMVMIIFGLASLLLAQVHHQIAVKKLKQYYPATQRSVSSVLSVLVLMFGLALFPGALFRQWESGRSLQVTVLFVLIINSINYDGKRFV